MIASATTDNSKEFTCASNDDDKDAMTTSEQLATSYKVCVDWVVSNFFQAIFAFYTFVIALAFLYYGVKVVHMLSDAEQFMDVMVKVTLLPLSLCHPSLFPAIRLLLLILRFLTS